jgi:uncharacterized repeat protein (TIGR01451 family)
MREQGEKEMIGRIRRVREVSACLRQAAAVVFAVVVIPAICHSTARAQVEMSKSAPPAAIAGTNITYTIQLNAINTVNLPTLTDPLPAGTTFVSLTAPPPVAGALPWSCTTPAVGANGAIECNKELMAQGESATFTLVARVCPEMACGATLANTATLAFGPAPQTAISRTTNTAIQTQSDLAITSSVAPSPARAGGDVAYTLTVANNGPSNSANTVVTNTLPPGFTIVSAASSLGSCAGLGTGAATCAIGTLGAANQCSTATPATATITIVAHVPSVSPPGVFGNAASVTSGNCLPDPNPNNNATSVNLTVDQILAGPGGYYPARSEMSGTKAGSVLFYGFYISDPGNPGDTNTRVNLTNTHSAKAIAVHLFFVDGATCSVADSYLCLTANQTASFLMSDVDPGTSGYIMAVAVDGPSGFAEGRNTGCPISFNYLIGHANVKLASSPRRETDLEAEACASEFGSPLPGCDPNNPTAALPFNGSANGYNRLPRALAASNIPSRADGNDTLLVVTRIGGNLATGAATLGSIFGILYDDAETPYSFSFSSGACQFRSSLSNGFPRTTPRFDQIIPAGRGGWLKLWGAGDNGIIGAMLNRNDNKRAIANAFEGGHILHTLTLSDSVTITIPVFPPSC